MSGRYVLSPRAQGDIDDIWEYTSRRWGIGQAETYTSQIWRHIEAVATTLAIGRDCCEIRAGYYKDPTGSHLLFFRLIDGGIDVVRILHERMDSDRHL
jgi:toxin ParE1/3/4